MFSVLTYITYTAPACSDLGDLAAVYSIDSSEAMITYIAIINKNSGY